MKDFNKIKEWMLPKLDKLGISVEQLAMRAGVGRAAIYHYFTDYARPTEQTMAKICHVIGAPLEEGLQQYTPRIPGRRKGTKLKEVTVRSRRS